MGLLFVIHEEILQIHWQFVVRNQRGCSVARPASWHSHQVGSFIIIIGYQFLSVDVSVYLYGLSMYVTVCFLDGCRGICAPRGVVLANE